MSSDTRHALDDAALDEIWIATARRLGFQVVRTADAYASFDGHDVIGVGTSDTLDDDDSVAQLVFHELCHALAQGDGGLHLPDWGLDNTSERDLVCEQACLRVQAHLADRFALRPVMTPTTISRDYYASLPPFPLEGSDEAATRARAGMRWAKENAWIAALEEALEKTAAVLAGARRWAMNDDVHPLGFARGPEDLSCSNCAWRYDSTESQVGARSRCRQSAGADGNGHRVDPRFPACAHWQAPLDCRACAACCREGFDSVGVGMREAVVWRHPALIVREGPRFRLQRKGGQCAALESTADAHACTIYEDRAQACREVMPGDRRCLSARRRIGLS